MLRKNAQFLLLTTGVAIMGLSACSTAKSSNPPSVFQNKIQIAESIERLELYGRDNGLVLSARDKIAVDQFLSNYLANGDGPIYLNLPSGAARNASAGQAEAIIRSGLPGVAVQSGQYQVKENSPAPVIVSYRTLKTVPQDCRYQSNLTQTSNNRPSSNFGCFHSANLAVMVGDPYQFIEPYPMTPPDSQRRSTVYEKYIEGTNPASDQPQRQDISVED